MSDTPLDIGAISTVPGSEIQADAAAEEEQDKTFSKASQEQELEQARLKNETLHLENESQKLKNEHIALENQTRKDDNEARRSFAAKIYWLTITWLVIIIVIVICTGCSWLKLSDKVLIALITSGSLNVLAFFLNVTKYLYHNDK